MRDWYGTEKSFETLKMVAAKNRLTVFVNDYELVIPNMCFYPCCTFNEILEKEESLKRACVSVEWMN